MTSAADGRGSAYGLVAVLCAIAFGLAVVLGIEGDVASTTPPSAAPARVSVAYGGCDEVRRGPVCLVADTATITLWLAEPSAKPTVRIDDDVVDARIRTVDGGWQVQVPVTSNASILSLGLGDDATWSMGIAPQPDRDEEALARLRAADRTEQKAIAVEAMANAKSPAARAKWASRVARIERDLGSAEWVASFEASIRAHRENGCLDALVNDLAVLSFGLRQQGSFSRAAEALQEMEALFDEMPLARIAHGYFRGMLAHHRGDPRTALESLEEVRSWSLRLADAEYRDPALVLEVILLSSLDREAEVERRLEELRRRAEEVTDVCLRASHLNNIAWFGKRLPSTARLIAASEAVRLFSVDCDRPARLRNSELTLAQTLLSSNRLDELEALLEGIGREFDAGLLSFDQEIAFQLTSAEVAVRRGQPQRALRVFRRVATVTGLHIEPSLHWEALTGVARVLELDGALDKAREAYAASDSFLDRLLLAIPLGEGRSSFVDSRLSATKRRLEVLLRLDRRAEAVAVARQSVRRRQMVGQLAARIAGLSPEQQKQWDQRVDDYRASRDALATAAENAWKMSRQASVREQERLEAASARLSRDFEELLAIAGVTSDRPNDELGPNEAEIVLHPGRHRTHLFVRSATDVHYVALEGSAPSGAEVLSSVARIAPGVLGSRLDIVSADDLTTPLHVAMLDERLGPFELVEYSVGGEARARPETASPRALLVIDPDGTLPGARAEALTLQRALEGADIAVDVLQGPAATRTALVELLEANDYQLLHFAGHASASGIDGWDSHLRLAGGERFDLPDIFAVEKVPQIVVLSSCDGGRGKDSPSLGLAQGFVARGARAVIAADGRVGDAIAKRMTVELYASLDPSFWDDPTRWLARVQRRMWTQNQRGWQGYRAYVR